MPNVQEAASTIKHIPSKKEWDAASIFKSSIAAPGHSVGLFNAHHLLKLDKIDFIEGCIRVLYTFQQRLLNGTTTKNF